MDIWYCTLSQEFIFVQPTLLDLQGSLFVMNLNSIHLSKEIWRDPEVFRPERFLNEKQELIHLDKVMSFGWGMFTLNYKTQVKNAANTSGQPFISVAKFSAVNLQENVLALANQ